MNNDLISRAALLEAIRTDVAPFTLSMEQEGRQWLRST